MLKDKSSSAIVGASDLERARDFYANTLGLELAEDMDGALTFRTGDTWLVVYQSEGFKPSTANAVAWGGGKDVETIADDLRRRGVRLEEYPDMGMEVDNGVHKDDDFRAIWFKDPDGNILHVNSM
ncbi:VOC family protein [Sphingomonas gilva]|uniref:VOC family protein n=1 Tax=Sphingomonas gilva TaxID=2305907 RepID=A0A396RW06_9SPHN|nr:VOC family protein [Sphingomonas gilva]RHW17861.1 VOC family protein [Sphingomonas gilva]